PARGDTSQYFNEQVSTQGVTVARDAFNGTDYFEDTAGGPGSGLLIFAPLLTMEEGDHATISGTVIEFGSASQNTEFSGLDYQNVDATGTALPAPVVVTPHQVGPLVGNKPYPGET